MVQINPIGSQGLENAVLPEGRIVAGNPSIWSQAKDSMTGQPKLRHDGQPQMQSYFGFAIPKQGEAHWKDTQWGALIYAEGMAGFPNGEHGAPTFAWKITDGDSQIPNKAGKKPVDQEGYRGHWILNISTTLAPVECYKRIGSNFGSPIERVTDAKTIKTGDYGLVAISVKDNKDKNGHSPSPGVYLNPMGFCMTREGDVISGEGAPTVNATAAFGGVVASTPTPAPVAPPTPSTSYMAPTPPTPPAAPLEEPKLSNGFTRSQLLAAGWSEAQIAAL